MPNRKARAKKIAKLFHVILVILNIFNLAFRFVSGLFDSAHFDFDSVEDFARDGVQFRFFIDVADPPLGDAVRGDVLRPDSLVPSPALYAPRVE